MAIILDGSTGISSIGTLTGVTDINSSTGVLATQNGMTGIAKAWVNFNGTGTVAIRDSFNVSFITDNGTGDYTINFITAMPNANYSWVGIAKGVDGAVNYNYPSVGNRFTTTPATTSIRVGTAFQQGGSASDFEYVYVAVFSS